MPPARKSDDNKTTPAPAKGTTAKTADEQPAPVLAPDVAAAVQESPDGAYSSAAADYADAARKIVDDMREQLDDLDKHFDEVQENVPGTDEALVADGVRRIPMALGELRRALEGLQNAAGELAQRAIR
jgi:hypothetical protein